VDRYTTEIVAREMKMLSPRGSDSGGSSWGGGPDNFPEPSPGFLGDTGDDVPF